MAVTARIGDLKGGLFGFVGIGVLDGGNPVTKGEIGS
jgi:hypothetical protein